MTQPIVDRIATFAVSRGGAPHGRDPATVQTQYSGQPRLRHRRVAGTALSGAA